MTRLWWLRSRHSSQLQQVQQRLEFAIKVGQLAVWDWDIANDQMSVDQEWARMFGYEYSGNSLTLADWVNKIHPDDAKAVMAAWDACLRHQTESFNKEYRVLQADGSERWIADFGQVLERDAHGKALRMVGIKQDITQRKLAQLAESEVRQQLSKLVAEVPGAVFQFRRDPQGQYSFPFASPGMEQMFGVDLEDIRNDASSILSRLSPLDFSRVIKSIESSAKSMSEWQEQVRILQKNGEYRWIAGHSKPNLLEDGSIMWYGHLQDVTAEIEVLQALKDNEAQLRLTLQAVHDGLWSYNHRSKVAQCDDRIREMLGYADDYWKTPSLKSILGLLHPQDRERLGVELDEMMVQHAREVLWMDFRLKTHDGQWLWVQARARVVEWDEHGSPARTVGILSDISQHVAESQLRQALLDRSPAAIVKMSHDRQVIDANDGYKQLFVPQGCPFKLFDIANLFVDKEQFEQVGQAYDLLSQLGSYRIDVQMKTVDGQIRWFDMQGVLQDPTDTSSPVIWTLIDITARREADQALRAERQRLHVLLERFPAGVLIEDHQQRIVFANERWCALMNCVIEPWALTGISRDGLEDLIGKTRTRWHYESLDYPCSHPGQKLQVQDDNSLYLEIDHIDVKQADDHLGTVWFVWDITDRKLRENQLNRWATTDGLTGLPNRRWFTEVFERHLHKQDENTLSRGVLMLLDIDHFKRVNDTHGHLAGDRVLRQMAQVLRENVRASDCAARLGGEEFAIFLPDTPMEYGLQVAERIRCSIQDHLVEHEGEVVGITVSVGLTALDSNDIQELLQQADSALYQAKKSGRNSICLWGRDVGKQ